MRLAVGGWQLGAGWTFPQPLTANRAERSMPERKSLVLRISPELWEQLQRMAEEELRSLNGQVEFLLREVVRKRRRKDVPEGKH